MSYIALVYMKRVARGWIIGGVLTLLAAIVVVLIGHRKEDPIEVRVDTVSVRTIVQVIAANGKIQPETEVKVSSEVSGEIITVAVKEGERVHRGQLLMRIRPDLVETQLEQVRATLRASEVGVEIAQVERNRTEQELKRATELYEKGFLSQQEFEAAKVAYQRAVGQYQSSLAEKSRAVALLRQTELTAHRTTIYAPISGIVTKLNVEEGEKVVGTAQMQGTELLRIAQLDTINAIVEVNENDVVLLHVGDTALVRVDAFRDTVILGLVQEISHSPLNKAIGTQDEVVNFQVKVRLLKPDVRLRPGMTCLADIRTARRDNVLSVPIQSVTVRYDHVRKEHNSTEALLTTRLQPLPQILFIVEGNRVRQRTVRTGLSDRGYIEIIDGVRKGEVVVSGPYSAITRTLHDSSIVTIKRATSQSSDEQQ